MRNNLLLKASVAMASVAFLLSCGSKNENASQTALKEVLVQYIGNELKLPSESECLLWDETSGLDDLDVDFMVVSYIDSEGCTPCHLHLPYWKEFNERLERLSGAVATAVLIICPDTLEKVAQFLHTAAYDYPVIVDTTGKFSKLNKLPEEGFLRTFLIDRNRRILSVGNPIENDAMRRHCLQLIGEAGMDEDTSVLSVERNTVDLGTVGHDYRRELEFYVENSSADTVSVENVLTSCGCLKATAASIPPHNRGVVKLDFDASTVDGAFHRSATVRYEGIERPLVFHLYGYVSDN